MSERRLKQLNILTIITIVTAVVLMCILSFGYAPEKQNKLDTTGMVALNEDWVIRMPGSDQDEIIKLPAKVKANTDDIIVIKHRVPDDVNSQSVLFFETKFQNVQAYIGDLRLYENGVMTDQKLLKNAVPCVNVIELGIASPGDIITIYMSSAYKRYVGKIGIVYYGSKGDVSSHLIRRTGIGFVLSISLLVIVILLAISLIFIRNVNVDKRKSGFAFCFVLSVALWVLFTNPIMQLITKNMYGVYMTSMILLLLMPIIYLMYQRCFATKARFAKIFEIGIYAYGINFLTGVVFQLVGVCDFAIYSIFTKVLIAIGLVLLSGIMYLAADTFSDKTIYNNFCANMVLTVGVLLEAILGLFKFYSPYDGVVLQISLYVFMILLVITVEKGIIYEMNQSTQRVISGIEHEKDMVIRNVNTQLIYKSLAQAAGNLKVNNMSEGKLIYDTSVYMKCNLKAATDKQLVTFDKELEYINAYLGIQSKRFPDLEITVEDKVVDFKVPYNSVEPLVENAIEYGALRSNSGGRFVLRAYERLDCYAIQIVDNGPGIHPDKEFYGNVTLKDIKKRLKSQSKAAIEVKCKPGKGTILTVKIPKAGYEVRED